VQQRGNHRRIDTTGQAQQNFLRAHLSADFFDLVFDDFRWGPQRFTATDFQYEMFKQALTLQGVGYFRVELYAEEVFLGVEHTGNRAAWR